MNGAIVLRTPAARVDLAGCYASIGERNAGAAHRFRLSAETTFAALSRTPGIGAPYETANPRLSGLRCARVRRFRNYLIFYRSIAGGIEIIRVLHAARDIGALLEEEE
jgi:toxin ParE1/3/4